MDRVTALERLTTCEPALRALGVESLSLFGSTARDSAVEASDVDVVVRLPSTARGFAVIGLLERIRNELTDRLGTDADVVPEPRYPGRVRAAIDADRLRVF
jgi:predicted nucleotidyltransferase